MAHVGMSALYVGMGARLAARRDEDIYDKLSCRYSVIICVVFTVLAITVPTFGDPMECFLNDNTIYPKVERHLINVYCSIHETYRESNDSYEPTHFQWAPIMLLCQTIVFVLSGRFWKACIAATGYDIHTHSKLDATDDHVREKQVTKLVNHLHKVLERRRNRTLVIADDGIFSQCCILCDRKPVQFFYMVSKFLKLFMLLGQFLFMLGTVGYWNVSFGNDMFNKMTNTTTAFFPKMVLCDFKIKDTDMPETFFCMVTYNPFFKTLFTILYWWVVAVFFLLIISTIGWFRQINGKNEFIEKHLGNAQKMHDGADREELQEFKHTYLGSDGIFMLRMLSTQLNKFQMEKVGGALWEKFKMRHQPEPINRLISDEADVELVTTHGYAAGHANTGSFNDPV